MASIALNLPIYDKGSLTAFRLKFEGYCALLKLEDDAQIKLLPMCFPSRRFDSIWETVDNRSTIKSIFDKISEFITQDERPVDPLINFIERKWQAGETIYEFVREIRHRAEFITKHKQAVEDLIKLQIIRNVPDSMKPIASALSKVDELVDAMATLPNPNSVTVMAATRPVQSRFASMVCYNCDKMGHTSRRCTAAKTICDYCKNAGHLKKHCRSKNGKGGSSP